MRGEENKRGDLEKEDRSVTVERVTMVKTGIRK